MNKFLKTIIGRLLFFFGGLLFLLGVAGLFSGAAAGSLLIVLFIFGLGFSMVLAGVVLRLA